MPIILHHHERFAGHGYPYGLRANEIPLGARIVAIADAYDAMIHDRPYKRAMSHDAAIDELRQHAGTQFDPELVALFCDLYTDHAPTPDPTILAITNPQPSPVVRRERRTASGRRWLLEDDGGGRPWPGRPRSHGAAPVRTATDRASRGRRTSWPRQERDRGRLTSLAAGAG